MQRICPVCNGLNELAATCPVCRATLDDCGPLEDYYGPYSPYEENELVAAQGDSVYEGFCRHLTRCSSCGHETRVAVPVITEKGGDRPD